MTKVKSFEYGLQIIDAAIEAQKKEHDSTFLVSGMEGSGKSTWLLHCIEHYCKRKNKPPTLEGMASSLSGFIHCLRLPPESLLELDEGSELSSDRQLEGLSKAIKQAFTVVRAKKYITLICFTNPMKVNTYFKEDRVKGLFFVVKRGLIYWYSQHTIINRILPAIKKMDNKSLINFASLKPDCKFVFPKYTGVLLEEYKRLKMENIDSVLDELSEEYGGGEVFYSLIKASKFLRVNTTNMRRFLLEGSIPYKKNATGTKFLIKETDLVNYLKNHQDKPISSSVRQENPEKPLIKQTKQEGL